MEIDKTARRSVPHGGVLLAGHRTYVAHLGAAADPTTIAAEVAAWMKNHGRVLCRSHSRKRDNRCKNKRTAKHHTLLSAKEMPGSDGTVPNFLMERTTSPVHSSKCSGCQNMAFPLEWRQVCIL